MFMDLLVLFSIDLVVVGVILFFEWDLKNGVCIGLMLCNGGVGDVIWVDIEVGFVFYIFNVYEDVMGNVVLDVVWYLDMWVEGFDEFLDDFIVECFMINLNMGMVSW